MTRVSIVIPCYNHARFLADAIESARAQTWRHVEIVVVDDGSSDDSAAVARRYPDVVLIRQKNRGLSSARNTGLRLSHGEILIFLDADDVLYPCAAEIAVEMLGRRPDAMMTFGRLELMDASGAAMRSAPPQVTGHFYEALLRRNYIGTPAMAAIRRQAFDHLGGFDPGCNPSADYDLYLRITRQYPIAVHDRIVARYRQHAGNMSRNPRLMLPATLAVLERQRPFIGASPALQAAHVFGLRRCREFYGEQMAERFRAAVRAPDRLGEALSYAWLLLKLYPRGTVWHLAKKASLMLRHAGRAIPPAETAAPTSRASPLPGSR